MNNQPANTGSNADNNGNNGLVIGKDGLPRCFWVGDDEVYIKYHDEEWGKKVTENNALFEKICLEGFQAGLSWLTILKKRENFRKAFDNFDFYKIATYDEGDIKRIVSDKSVIRHCKKIESVINNAKRAIELLEEFDSLEQYFWQWKPEPASRPKIITYETTKELDKTAESIALSKDMKKRGWTFIGPTTAYAFMQSVGMVNDHIHGCHFRNKKQRC